MRRIGTIANQQAAERCLALLAAAGVECELHSDEDEHTLWVLDDENHRRAVAFFQKFSRDPAAYAHIDLPKQVNKPATSDRGRYVDVRTEVFNRHQGHSNRSLTIALISGCVLMFVGMKGGLPNAFIEKLFIASGFFTYQPFAQILSGEVWRLVTPIFLHFGILHLGFNMLWLYQLGSAVESLESSKKLGLLILVTAALSNSAQYVVGGPNFGGMSGVVYGLLSYAWGMGRWRPSSNYFVDKGTFIFMLIWLVLCFFGIFGPIANTAHLIGLLVGLGWARLATR